MVIMIVNINININTAFYFFDLYNYYDVVIYNKKVIGFAVMSVK